MIRFLFYISFLCGCGCRVKLETRKTRSLTPRLDGNPLRNPQGTDGDATSPPSGVAKNRRRERSRTQTARRARTARRGPGRGSCRRRGSCRGRAYHSKPAQVRQHLPQLQQGGVGDLLQQRMVRCTWMQVHPGEDRTTCRKVPARPGAPGSPAECKARGNIIYILEFRPAKVGPPWAMDKHTPIVTAYGQIYANSDSI